MQTMNISLPEPLKEFIDEQVGTGRYSSASDYMRDLVRRDQESEPNDVEWVKAMLAEGEASGVIDKDPREVLEEIIAERRARNG